jgi:tetratricopeptide (TPR) repeat protein
VDCDTRELSKYRQKIVAPVVTVEVGVPRGIGELAVWEAINGDSTLAYFLQTGDAQHGDRVVMKAEQLVRWYPDNGQEKHLALALGKHYLGQDKVETAIGYFKEAADSAGASSLRASALLELTQSYIKKGDLEEALRISDAADSEYNGREIQAEFESLGSKIRQVGKTSGSGRVKIQE